MDIATFVRTEYTSHFQTHKINLYVKKLMRLHLANPYNIPGVLFNPIGIANHVPYLKYPDIYK